MKTRALGDSNNVGLKEKEGPLQSCSRSEAHKPKLIRQKKKNVPGVPGYENENGDKGPAMHQTLRPT